MNKKGKELGITELELAKIRQAETDCKTAEANFRKAEAALYKFYATGPRKKKKSGRPGFWKSQDGLFFVSEVERFRKERKFKTRAITAALKQTKRWSELAKTYGINDPVIVRAARLEPISKSFEEDDEAGKLDKAEEVVGVVLPANEDPALPLNPGEEALDEPASHVAA
jgi:hypothetical protein